MYVVYGLPSATVEKSIKKGDLLEDVALRLDVG